jgi:hypothetical protein
MLTRKRHSFRRLLFALGIAFPGLIGILVARAEAVTDEKGRIQPALQAQATATITDTPTLPVTATLPFQTSTESPLLSLPTSVSVLPSGL